MTQQFNADQFLQTEFDSAEQKAKFANHFVRFVESDFKASLFYNWFYTRLSMTFGHIAHYDRNGFFQTFFADTKGKLDFAAITAGHCGLYADPNEQLGGMGICGDPRYTYSDVERALRVWARESRLSARYQKRLDGETEVFERAELAKFQAKYPDHAR